ncbi:unnamed protein product [Phytophthora fragariaefolia]|uniref:Unnamed protein product n=1 Tax=Phytophthora fragariaefolia TaxID=1490495 RepID=A0A9W6X619_9STRA|nr:unnamed protein product [Phytophthora fragariaefolia]
MDHRAIIDRGAQLREVYLELGALVLWKTIKPQAAGHPMAACAQAAFVALSCIIGGVWVDDRVDKQGRERRLKRWKAKGSPESLTEWNQNTESSYDVVWMLIKDAERGDPDKRSTHRNAPLGESDAPDEWAPGDKYSYPHAYTSAVLEVLRTKKGGVFEKQINHLEAVVVNLQQLAIAKQVKLGIKWSQRS